MSDKRNVQIWFVSARKVDDQPMTVLKNNSLVALQIQYRVLLRNSVISRVETGLMCFNKRPECYRH